MTAYRFYLLNPLGHVTGVRPLDAASDAEARAKAFVLGQGLGLAGYELWEHDRSIVVSELGRAAAAPSLVPA